MLLRDLQLLTRHYFSSSDRALAGETIHLALGENPGLKPRPGEKPVELRRVKLIRDSRMRDTKEAEPITIARTLPTGRETRDLDYLQEIEYCH